MKFDVKITDAWAVDKATVTQYDQLTVTIPLNDARTGRVTISVYDAAAEHAIPLSRFLKVYYRGLLVFWGPILTCEWDASGGTVAINAVDTSARLKKHFVRDGDAALEIGCPSDAIGMRRLVEAAQNTPAQDALPVPPLGIREGQDNSTHQHLKIKPVARGTNVWEQMTSIATQVTGPDFELEPLEWTGDNAIGFTGRYDHSGSDAIADSTVLQIPFVVTPAVTNLVGRVEVLTYISHSDTSKLRLSLIAPDGTLVKLAFDRGTGADFGTSSADADMADFRDTAGIFIDDATAVNPFSGAYKPEQDTPFDIMAERDGAGTWIFQAHDTGGGGGTLHKVSLKFSAKPISDLPTFARLNCNDKQGVAREVSVAFQYGYGADNCSNVGFTPDGDAVRNHFVCTSKGLTSIRNNPTAWIEYGIYAGWRSSSDKGDTQAILDDIAEAMVGAYSRPPLQLKVEPKLGDAAGKYYGQDFHVGDTITVGAQKGYMNFSTVARITAVTLSQQDQAGNEMQSIECVPRVADPAEVVSE